MGSQGVVKSATGWDAGIFHPGVLGLWSGDGVKEICTAPSPVGATARR